MATMVSMPAALAETDRDPDPATLAEVERQFRVQLSPLRLFPGAALAIYHRGRLVLDLVGGLADSQRGAPVCPETLFPLFSGTKPFAAVALWQQIERGRLNLDDPVAAYWPAFGPNGKERVLVRHLLSHRGGFPTTPADLPRPQWGDWQATSRAMAAISLEHEPGTTSAYHYLTQHWACAELLRRLDGREYCNYLREEITVPLGMSDTFVGLPMALEHRIAALHGTDGTDERGRDMIRANRELPLHRMAAPGASGVSTARDMARFYAAIAAGGALDGVRLLRPESVARMLQVEVDGEIDHT